MRGFSQPSGVVDVQLDKSTNRLATPSCPETYTAAFVAGTEPHRDSAISRAASAASFSHLMSLGDKPCRLHPTRAQAATDNQTGSDAEKEKKDFSAKLWVSLKEDKSSSKPIQTSGRNGKRSPLADDIRRLERRGETGFRR